MKILLKHIAIKNLNKYIYYTITHSGKLIILFYIDLKMINSVLFMSRLAFNAQLKPTPNMIAISITAGDAVVPLERGFAGAIRLEFEDLSEEKLKLAIGDIPDLHEKHLQGVRIFYSNFEICDFNDAGKVVRFLNHYHEKSENFELVVHCEAGISRSAAVARFASEAYGAKINISNSDTSFANKRLLRLLNKAYSNEQPIVGIIKGR